MLKGVVGAMILMSRPADLIRFISVFAMNRVNEAISVPAFLIDFFTVRFVCKSVCGFSSIVDNALIFRSFGFKYWCLKTDRAVIHFLLYVLRLCGFYMQAMATSRFVITPSRPLSSNIS